MDAVFPEARSVLKDADPEMYDLVQAEKVRQWCAPVSPHTDDRSDIRAIVNIDRRKRLRDACRPCTSVQQAHWKDLSSMSHASVTH
jgi:hypothetical protein